MNQPIRKTGKRKRRRAASPAKRRGRSGLGPTSTGTKVQLARDAGQTEEFGLGGAWQELVHHLASQYKKGNP